MNKRNLATVRFTGKRYFVYSSEGRKVRCRGEVIGLGGFAATHGPDKVFFADAVTIHEVDVTEELLQQLYKQGTGNDYVAPSPAPAPKVKVIGRKKWVKTEGEGTHRVYTLTAYARRHLEAEGYDVARDRMCDVDFDEDWLQSAAMDMALYHPELTADGVREGYTFLREAAADVIYGGMQRAVQRRDKGT